MLLLIEKAECNYGIKIVRINLASRASFNAIL